MFRFAVDGSTPEVVGFGRGRDVPVTGDWDGDGTTDVGVRRPGARKFLLRNGDGTLVRVQLGAVGSIPVTGDWNADGVTDVGVFDPATATFSLRLTPPTSRSTSAVTTVQFGRPR